MVSIAFNLQALPEKRLELVQTLEAVMEKTTGMKDCLSCALQQNHNNPNALSLKMEWRSREAFHDYQQSDHFGVLLGAFNLLCASKKISITP